MIRTKLIAGMFATLFSLSVPTLAFAADQNPNDAQHEVGRRNDREMRERIEQLRADIERREIDIARDRREHRYADARRDEREVQREKVELERLLHSWR